MTTEIQNLKWNIQDIDRSAQAAIGIRDYVEKLEAMAALARRAAEDVVKRGEIVEKNGDMVYKGVARVEAIVGRSDGRVIITAKYGDRTTAVELEGMERFAIFANLAAIAVRDDPNFYRGYMLHRTSSAIQAADRLFMWGALMPGKYVIDVRRVYISRDALSPWFLARSLFGQNSLRTIMASPIHRTILRAAMDLGGLDGDRVLVIAWLLISAIFNTPEGGRPSDGLSELAKRLAVKGGKPEEEYKIALEPLRPHIKELDAILGPISRGDKAFLAAKMADYSGRIVGDRAAIPINMKAKIILDGIEIDMADIFEAAAKAFSTRGGLYRHLIFAGISPVKGPAIKAAAREMNELIKYGDPIEVAGIIEITPVEVGEVAVKITPENLEEVLRGFKGLYYTHLRLIINGKKYDFLCMRGRYGRLAFMTRATAELEGMFGERRNKKIEFGVERMKALAMTYEAYAVRRAKKGEAMWPVKIKYKGTTIELKMTYIADRRRLQRISNGGRIEAVVDGKPVEIDLADIRERRGLGGIIAEALDAAGVKWHVGSKHFYIRLLKI
ncbi:MAG: hypothetical protein JZD41_04365 [Thermoproteus sp.]|nr:hypothetical protein [Thermoproteus sp.]